MELSEGSTWNIPEVLQGGSSPGMLNSPLGFLGWAVPRGAGTQFVGPAGSGCRTEQEEERVEWQACGSRDCSSEPVQPRCRGLIWSEPALALSLGLPLMGHQEALHRPSARWLGSPLRLTCLLTQPLGCTVTDLETRDPRGQAEAMRASLGAQPRDGEGFPSFCLYMAEKRRQHWAGPEVLF